MGAVKCRHCNKPLVLVESGLICSDGCGGVVPITQHGRANYPRHLRQDSTKINAPKRRSRKPIDTQVSLFDSGGPEEATNSPEDSS